MILKLEETIHSLHYENTLQKEQKCTPECLQIKNTFITTSERLENALLGEKTWRNKYQEQFNLIKTYSDRIKEIEPLLDFYKNNLDDANSKYSIYKENQQLVNENNVNIIASLKQTIENHIITQETISNNLNDLELELKATRDRYDVDVMILNNKIESLIEYV